jgi:deoxyribose-phosphate aldolase
MQSEKTLEVSFLDYSDILKKVDHTLLSPDARWSEIRELCDDAIRFGTASVCIPASYVKKAKEYVCTKMKICTVIGFPTGYSTTAAKCFEAGDAVANGADEIDMVINIGFLKDKLYDCLLDEIKAVKSACKGRLLKVIIETCLLSDEEKMKMCEIVSLSGADYIKTSTGFSTGGATREDIKLMAENVAPQIKIKAAGGIKTVEDAQVFINLGADRLGTSTIIKLIK